MKLTILLCSLAVNSLIAADSFNEESFNAFSQQLEEIKKEEAKEAEAALALSHEPLNMMLKKYVSANGAVNYAGFKSDPNMGRYIGTLESANPASMTRKEKMAFWINVYNVYTIKLIIDNGIPKSIKDIGSPWDKKFIPIAGKTYSLNQVENEILRPQFNDARIHFAINCASVSCPKLHNAAFTAENLEGKLTKLTREFVNDSKMNQISAESIKVSSIFDWYAVDFKNNGTLIDWLNKYSNTNINSDAKLSYMTYNWNLNGK